jgi:hypothetical protein
MKQAEQDKIRLPSSSVLWDKAKSYRDPRGYIVLYATDPSTKRTHYRMEHIIIWERAHGTQVPKTHCIHHLNGITYDNRVMNLLCIPKTAHMRIHKELRKLAQDLAPTCYHVKSHAIIKDHVDKAQEQMARKARWGIVVDNGQEVTS